VSNPTRMFTDPTTGMALKTWNVFVGCKYDCTYCNAKVLANTRLKHNLRYRDGFEKPHLVPELLARTFKPGEFIFAGYMGDISFATRYEFWQILSRIRRFPDTDFLLITKNPAYFLKWPDPLPTNVIPGTTVETNRDHGLSRAPAPLKRWMDLQALRHRRKFLSIEPVMDFDPRELTRWIGLLEPAIIEVGADNYHNNLPEPSWEKVEQLLEFCRGTGASVVEKPGLERLRGT
jgi:DNA repair photolyase